MICAYADRGMTQSPDA